MFFCTFYDSYNQNCYCKKGFLRARVINLGASTARNCEAKVLVQEEGKPTPLDPQILHWARNIPYIIARNPREAFSPIDVGFEETLDIFEIYCNLKGDSIIKAYSLYPSFLLKSDKKI